MFLWEVGTRNPALPCFIVVMMSGPVGNSLTSVVSSTSDKEWKLIIHFFFFYCIDCNWCCYLGYPIPFMSRINQLDDQHLICSVMTLWVTMGKRDNLILFLPVHTGTLHPQMRTGGLDVNIHLQLPYTSLSFPSVLHRLRSSIFIISSNKGNNLVPVKVTGNNKGGKTLSLEMKHFLIKDSKHLTVRLTKDVREREDNAIS